MESCRKRRTPAVATVCILLFLLLGCGWSDVGPIVNKTFNDKDDQDQARREERDREARANQAQESPAPSSESAFPNSTIDVTGKRYVVFAFSGENPPFHTALLNSTPIILVAKDGTAAGGAQKNTNDTYPSTGQPVSSTDIFEFIGMWYEDTGIVSGDIQLTIEARSPAYDESDTPQPATNIQYRMSGTLQARRVEGTDTLNGYVTGTAVQTQTWPGDDRAPSEQTYPINWTITGTLTEG